MRVENIKEHEERTRNGDRIVSCPKKRGRSLLTMNEWPPSAPDW